MQKPFAIRNKSSCSSCRARTFVQQTNRKLRIAHLFVAVALWNITAWRTHMEHSLGLQMEVLVASRFCVNITQQIGKRSECPPQGDRKEGEEYAKTPVCPRFHVQASRKTSMFLSVLGQIAQATYLVVTKERGLSPNTSAEVPRVARRSVTAQHGHLEHLRGKVRVMLFVYVQSSM